MKSGSSHGSYSWQYGGTQVALIVCSLRKKVGDHVKVHNLRLILEAILVKALLSRSKIHVEVKPMEKDNRNVVQ